MTLTKPALMGATEPRIHTPYLTGKTRGNEVAQLADDIGMPLLPWQAFVIDDMCRVNEQNLFRRKTNLVLCARQNGKTHLARMMMLAHLYLFDSRNVVIMSSNRSMALDTFRQVAYAVEDNPELSKRVKQIRYANGTESIELKSGARLDVVAATRDGSRGRTADLLYIDELREITEEGFQAASPITRARPNAQSLYTSNAGDAFSTVLNELREKAMSTPPDTFGFYEYSAPQFVKIDNRKAWAMANPGLGYMISEEAIADSIATAPVETTRTETLCSWISSLVSPWPYLSIENASDSALAMGPGPVTVFGFDVSPSRRDASLVMGQILPSGKIGVAVLETFTADVSVDELFVASRIKYWADMYFPRTVCFDKYTTATIAQRLQLSGVATEDISGQRAYQACGDLYDSLSNNRLVHSGQESLVNHMANCAAKLNDASWRIVRRKSAGPVDIAIGISMVVHILAQPIAEAKVYS